MPRDLWAGVLATKLLKNMLDVVSLGKDFSLRQDKKKKDAAAGRDPRDEGKVFHALRKVDFSVPRGSITGLLGANGAGKTTLMRILATSLKPSTGSVSLMGYDAVKDANEVRKRVGFLSGTTGLYNRLNAEELLIFFGRLYGMPQPELQARIQTLLDELEIRSFAHRRIDNLSAGMKQRIAIARSLIHMPEFIIFDEPTTGLDVPTAQIILSHIERCREASRSVIFSTHHMHEVEKLCDQVILIHQGLVRFKGSVEEMKRIAGCRLLDDAYLTLTGERGAPLRSPPPAAIVTAPDPTEPAHAAAAGEKLAMPVQGNA